MLHPTMTELTFYINNGAQLLLAAYFAKKYLSAQIKACAPWSLGFLSYATSGIFFELIKKDFFAYTTSNIFLRATLIAIGIALFYYGASLLFFEDDFFKQEGITLGLFSIMLLCNIYLAYTAEDVTSFVKSLNLTYVYLFIFPLFTLISVFFYQIHRRLPFGDSRRKNMLLLSLAWVGLALFNLLYPLTYATDYHWLTRTGTITSRILLLYGMIYAEI
jgi:hypothetical protein